MSAALFSLLVIALTSWMLRMSNFVPAVEDEHQRTRARRIAATAPPVTS